MPVQTTTHEGQLNSRQEKTYVHPPFEVPAGAVCIEVSNEYDQPISAEPAVTGGNTIDLGFFSLPGLIFLMVVPLGMADKVDPDSILGFDKFNWNLVIRDEGAQTAGAGCSAKRKEPGRELSGLRRFSDVAGVNPVTSFLAFFEGL